MLEAGMSREPFCRGGGGGARLNLPEFQGSIL